MVLGSLVVYLNVALENKQHKAQEGRIDRTAMEKVY
jgi:hypothetical protein